MFGTKHLAAVVLASSLTALTPQFAEASSRQACANIANSHGIHQYQVRRGLSGFQEARGIGCEYRAIGNHWRVMNTFNLRNDRERTNFYRQWDRAQQQNNVQRQRSVGRGSDGIRDLNRALRDVDRLGRTLERMLR